MIVGGGREVGNVSTLMLARDIGDMGARLARRRGAVRVHARPLDGDAIVDLAVATFAAGEVTILPGP